MTRVNSVDFEIGGNPRSLSSYKPEVFIDNQIGRFPHEDYMLNIFRGITLKYSR